MLDRDLLRQYAEAGSEDAFAELVRRHLPLVYSAALRQVHGDEATAKDVSQVVFFDLAQKARALSERMLLTSWLYTSTRFAASKVLRGEQRRQLREQTAAALQETSAQTGVERTWAELSPLLDEAMGLLEVADRDVILLRFFENKPFKEVGAAFGLSEDAARMRVNRALETLRSALEARGARFSAAALAAALSCEAVKAAPAGLASTISAAALAGATGMGFLGLLARALAASKLKAAAIGVAALAAAVAIPVLLRPPAAPELRAEIPAPRQPAASFTEANTGSNPLETAASLEAPRLRMPGQPMPMPRQPRPPPGPALPGPEVGASPRLPTAEQMALLRRPSRDTVFDAARQRMVTEQLVARGIANEAVLQAMGTVKRHSFTAWEEMSYAYADRALGVRYSQPVETPYVIASVAERLEPKPTDRILEIDTGFGYQTAVLGQLVQSVYTVEAPNQWADLDLQGGGYTNNIFVRKGDFDRGWPEAAPFDSIVFNGRADQIAPSVVEQLKEGGRLVVPVGEDNNLHVFTKVGGRLVPYLNWPVRPPPIPGNEVTLPPVPKIELAPPGR